ncbi:lysozyme inhibitor LprI family protein [Stappia sp.]|jgi:uncharacterized protein YecT (DUF1311 family)|uniref:lysozyme inhibitor LprI family protein n=1 Tax=Stappia sp. TaxID=1870903 RepID=UPI003D0E1485
MSRFTATMMLMSGLLAAGVLQASTVPLGAQQAVDCDAPQAQMEMTYCAEQAWQAADKDLNAAYARATAAMRSMDTDLPPEMKGAVKTLREAQRAWIAYRDKACAAYGFLARGGSMEPMLIYGCYADLTTNRTGELEQLATGLGN